MTRRIAGAAALLPSLLLLPNACVVIKDGSSDSASGSVAVVDLDSVKRASVMPPDSVARARASMQRVVDSVAIQHMSDSVRAALALDSMRPTSTVVSPTPDGTPNSSASGCSLPSNAPAAEAYRFNAPPVRRLRPRRDC